jgi:hypothetical protein
MEEQDDKEQLTLTLNSLFTPPSKDGADEDNLPHSASLLFRPQIGVPRNLDRLHVLRHQERLFGIKVDRDEL